MGPSMVGFGRYGYRYDSGHGGESLVVGAAHWRAPGSGAVRAGSFWSASRAMIRIKRAARQLDKCGGV